MLGATFLGVTSTVPLYRLAPIRDFHGLANGTESVEGELFEVSAEKLLELDDWEYDIFARQVVQLVDGHLADAYMLVIDPMASRVVARWSRRAADLLGL